MVIWLPFSHLVQWRTKIQSTVPVKQNKPSCGLSTPRIHPRAETVKNMTLPFFKENLSLSWEKTIPTFSSFCAVFIIKSQLQVLWLFSYPPIHLKLWWWQFTRPTAKKTANSADAERQLHPAEAKALKMRKDDRDCDNNLEFLKWFDWLTGMAGGRTRKQSREHKQSTAKNNHSSSLKYCAKGSNKKSKWKCLLLQWPTKKSLQFLYIKGWLPNKSASLLWTGRNQPPPLSRKTLSALLES